MKVILQRDIPKLGKTGDIVPVKDGFARNYLLPRSLAVAATGGAMKDHNARQARERERGTKMLSGAQGDADKLGGLVLTIIGKVGSGTKMYGSVTAQDVSDAILKERGITVDKRRVGLVDPIKTLGSYTIPVRLHSDITIPVTLEVLTEEEIQRRNMQAEAAALAAESKAAEAAVVEAAPTEAAADETPTAAEDAVAAPETPVSSDAEEASETESEVEEQERSTDISP